MKDNKLDPWYQSLLSLLVSEDQNYSKSDRTGTGTKSLFGVQFRHDMSDGFPLLTTKKMAWKVMVTELLWFLSGSTNIQYLVKNGCHIWDGDAYKNYVSKIEEYTSTLNVPNNMSEFQEIMDSVGNQIRSSVLSKEEFINKIKTDDEFAKKWGELGPIYGKQWRKWTKKKMYLSTDGSYENIYDEADQTVIDQISGLISELKTNPDSRRLMVSAWNVGELDQMVLPPCHYGFQMYTRELSFDERHLMYCKSFKNTDDIHKGSSDIDKMIEYHNSRNIPTRAISLMWNQRSVDTALGLPMNIASYALLLLMIADEVNMIPDQLIGNLGDVHLYSDHLEGAKEQMTRTSYELPTVHVRDGIFCSSVNDVILENYKCHPKIYFPLSN